MGVLLVQSLISARLKAYGINYAALFDGSTGYLSRMFAGNGGDTWTADFWVCKYDPDLVDRAPILEATDEIAFNADETFNCRTGGFDRTSMAVYRDASAFTHVHIECTAGTPVVKINGSVISLSSTPNFTAINSAILHRIGYSGSSRYAPVILAAYRFISNAVVNEAEFAEFDQKTGNWKPKRYAGAYGTNGFYLDFSGADVSGVIAETSVSNDTDISHANESTREVIAPAELDIVGRLVRVKFQAGTLNILNIDAAYVGIQATSGNDWDYDGNQVQLTFDGGAAMKSIASSGSAWSDWVRLDTDPSKGLVIGIDYGSTAISYDTSSMPANYTAYFKSSSDDAAITAPSGFLSSNRVHAFSELEIVADEHIGQDRSGNDNDFVASGTMRQVTSTPTNTTVTLNPLVSGAQVTLSEGNLHHSSPASTGNAPQMGAQASLYIEEGAFSFEWECLVANAQVGWCEARNDPTGENLNYYVFYRDDGIIRVDGTEYTGYATYSVSDIIRCEIDLDADTFEFFKNDVSIYSGSLTTTGVKYFPTFRPKSSSSATAGRFTFAEADWVDAPTAGFKALCTDNLPAQSGSIWDHLFIKLRTGTSVNTSVTDCPFTPGMLWSKATDSTSYHRVFDALRSVIPAKNQEISTDNTNAQGTGTSCQVDFTSNGYEFSDGSSSWEPNYTGASYVDWVWNLPSSETNTSGDIAVDWIYNATLGMAVGKYTGNGSTPQTLGLPTINGNAPKMFVIKNLSTARQWPVYHKALGPTKHLFLDDASAAATTSWPWNDTAPTSSVVTITNDNTVNTSGDDYLIICFWETDYCKIGGYATNNAQDGPYIPLGGMPHFFMGKADAAVDWVIQDSVRDSYNPVEAVLEPNTSESESTTTIYGGEANAIYANGFKVDTQDGRWNAGSTTVYYLAFVQPNGPTENPGR